MISPKYSSFKTGILWLGLKLLGLVDSTLKVRGHKHKDKVSTHETGLVKESKLECPTTPECVLVCS